MLLLVMFRPEFQPPWTGQPRVTMLTMARLDRRDTAAMVTNVAGGAALPDEIMEEIVERTDGVPLFIEELTKALLESGVDGAAALSSMPHAGLSVPARLHASLIARLDHPALAPPVVHRDRPGGIADDDDGSAPRRPCTVCPHSSGTRHPVTAHRPGLTTDENICRTTCHG